MSPSADHPLTACRPRSGTLATNSHRTSLGVHALDNFYHPFAYAAGRGHGLAGAMRESLIPERSAV